MKDIINLILLCISTITIIYGIYFSISGIIGIIKKNKVKFKSSLKFNHFAIIIPARNESLVIANLIESLLNLNYPKDKYDIFVVPNNCTDNTKEIALNNGAKIIDCNIPTKTKGDVLNVTFNTLKNDNKIDAYIIFDADNVVHPEFLTYMNDCLNSGYRVAQGFRAAKNPSDNGMSGSYTLFYLLQNIFFNRARMAINGSASINGTGFMVKKELIDEYGFETFTLTEDIEFTGICAFRNEKIAFVEDAITYDEYPVKFIPSWHQRRRWTSGTLECMKRYSLKLFKNFIKTGNIASLDMSLMYTAAVIQLLSLIGFILTFVSLNLHLEITYVSILKYIIEALISLYVSTIIIELIALIYKKRNLNKIWQGVLTFPLFMLSWLPISVVCFISKKTKWDIISHSRNVNIKDILNEKK